MNIGGWIVVGIIAVFSVLVVAGADVIERRYNQMHPPDDWDGMREDKDNGDSSK